MKQKKRKKKSKLKMLLVSQAILLGVVLCALAIYFFGGYAGEIGQLRRDADRMVAESTPATFRSAQTSVIYDVNGKEITVVKGEKDSYYLEYDYIPEGVKAAIISIEDKRFYQHHGVEPKAVMRALLAMLRDKKITQGGSTITQQLARTVFLSNERTWQRKVAEMFIATGLEKKYDKDQILEYYLNNVYFGNGYYGIEAAARGYFSKGVSELGLADQALLCGIPNNPTTYDPVENPDNAMARRNRILQQMCDDGRILWETCQEEQQKPLTLKRQKRKKYDYIETYTYYCATRALMEANGFEFQKDFDGEEERQEYEDAYSEAYADCQRSLFTGGYRIHTSIDPDIQKMLQDAVDSGLSGYTDTNGEGIYKLQGSAVCIDNGTGRVAAIVGGRSQEYDGYTLNRAYQSYRQPGSAAKPLIVYTPQLERGYTPDSIVRDEKFEGGPANSAGVYSGDITLRYAVEQSKNTIAWKLFDELGPAVGMRYLKEMDFAKIDESDEVPAASLGGFTHGASAVEMAGAYAAIENDGVFRAPTCIARIEDADGGIIYESADNGRQVYEQNAARMMTDMLATAMTNGTAKGLGLGAMPSAGKTGTTDDHKDGWFCGYTRYYTAAVWVGYDMPKVMKDLSGSTYPGRIWHGFMEKLHAGLEPKEFMPYVGYEDSVHVPADDDEEPDKNKNKDKKPAAKNPAGGGDAANDRDTPSGQGDSAEQGTPSGQDAPSSQDGQSGQEQPGDKEKPGKEKPEDEGEIVIGPDDADEEPDDGGDAVGGDVVIVD